MLRALEGLKVLRARRLLAAAAAGLVLALSCAPAGAGDAIVASAPSPAGSANLLYGVGLVIGLPGTGDSAIDEGVVDHSIVGVLKRAGMEPWQGAIAPGKVAAVTLSAELPPGAPDGAKLEVRITPLGNARSLAGGTLLVAPLHGADGVVYALGQGAIASGNAEGNLVTAAATDRQEARLAAGAVIQRRLISASAKSSAGQVAQN